MSPFLRRGERQHGTGLRRRHVAVAVGVGSVLLLSACGGDQGGPPVLNWYINNAGQEPIGERCTTESDGQYTIDIQLLPNNAAGQREQILRRLAAEDSSVDIISLDPPYMPELAYAGFLRPFTDEERAEFSEGVLEGPLEQSLFDDTMFAAPFYGNTQLLWYRKSVAEKAGLNLENEPVTWDQLIKAANQTRTTMAVQGRKDESLMVWVNALVESAGGRILEDTEEVVAADQVQAAIGGEAGEAAARIMNTIAEAPSAPPALSTAGEEQSRAAFQDKNGGFMVNWPYVWPAFDAGIADGSLPEDFKDDVGWARYPRVNPDEESSTPLGGIGLSVGAFTSEPDLAVEAIRCLRSVESQVEYMLTGGGDPGASEEVYENPDVREKYPMYELIKQGLIDAGPRPNTPYYGDVTGTIQDGYHPPDELSADTTPQATANMLEAVLSNEQLL